MIYLNTFSKSLSSALRIAYLVLPASLDAAFDERLGFLSTTVPAIDQVALAQALESGAYERHVARYRRDMREVRDALAEGLLDGPAGQRVRIEEADSGIHFVLAVEDDGRGEAGIAAAARETGVGLTPLSSFVRASTPGPQTVLPGLWCSTTAFPQVRRALLPRRSGVSYRPSRDLTCGNGSTLGCPRVCSPRSRSIHTVSYQRPNL